MAGAGAKKRHEENRKHISVLRLWLASGILSFLLVRMVYMGGSSSTTLWVAFFATSLVAYVCYRGIAALAAPTYGPRGELLDGGADMAMKGFCGHYHDLLYITVIVQASSAAGFSMRGGPCTKYVPRPQVEAYHACLGRGRPETEDMHARKCPRLEAEGHLCACMSSVSGRPRPRQA
eukprot:362070-Chlamydomonas_euryale.AAC.21